MGLEFELVLPCYNESRSIEFLLKRAVSAAIAAGMTQQMFQLVLVENGSRDESLEVMSRLKSGELGSWFRVVTVTPNQGYGNGLWAGLTTTSALFIGWSHADQQCDPQDAFAALKNLKSSPSPESTLIKGVRTGRGWKDKLVSRVFEMFALLLMRFPIYEVNAQPKVFHRSLLLSLKDPPKGFEFDLYVLFQAYKNRYAFKSVSVLFPSRIHGISNWASNFISRYKTIMNMIVYMAKLGRERL